MNRSTARRMTNALANHQRFMDHAPSAAFAGMQTPSSVAALQQMIPQGKSFFDGLCSNNTLRAPKTTSHVVIRRPTIPQLHGATRHIARACAWNERGPDGLAKRAVGSEIANVVARRVASGTPMCESHEMYCGVGFFAGEQMAADEHATHAAVVIAHVEDGCPTLAIREFATAAEFSQWLSRQSDFSMSGFSVDPDHLVEPLDDAVNNQRPTVVRLREFMLTGF